MTREEFRELTQKQIVFLDGATGTHLIAAGMPQGICAEAWVREHPEVVLQLQNAYVEAGSNIIIAPTFGANRVRLKGFGKDKDIAMLNTENVKLSKEAAAGRALVAGNVSMTGLIIYPDDDESFDEAVDVYKEQAELLAAAGCDLFAVETMISLEDARAALHAIKAVTDLPVMVTMSFEANGRTLYGDKPETVAEVLTEEGADAVGTNCSTGPEHMKSIIEIMTSVTKLPVIAKPNAGLPKPGPDGSVTYDLSAQDFADGVKQLVDAGARIAGGCCGTGPEYIRLLRESLLY